MSKFNRRKMRLFVSVASVAIGIASSIAIAVADDDPEVLGKQAIGSLNSGISFVEALLHHATTKGQKHGLLLVQSKFASLVKNRHSTLMRIHELYKSGDKAVSLEALGAIVKMKSPRSADILRDALNYEVLYGRVFAAGALLEMGPKNRAVESEVLNALFGVINAEPKSMEDAERVLFSAGVVRKYFHVNGSPPPAWVGLPGNQLSELDKQSKEKKVLEHLGDYVRKLNKWRLDGKGGVRAFTTNDSLEKAN